MAFQNRIFSVCAAAVIACGVSSEAHADDTCSALPSFEALKNALVSARKEGNGGLNLDMWGTIVDRSGTVCAVAYTGSAADSQWPGSRVISAQKANTANAFSLAGLALSTANLYSATQPGASLFGLQESNPVDTDVAYSGSADEFGTSDDPMVGERIGGVNVFGGGLALYSADGKILGGLGVSGDTSCADHNIAWRTRNILKLDTVPSGVAPTKNDQIIFDIDSGKSAGGFGHPKCGGTEDAIAAKLAPTAVKEAAKKE
ncbi:MAG: heme-binding protein [Deltaproteobacteria bacterium]|nr:heme-binding protein [Deltaproteobacteria bacterium]